MEEGNMLEVCWCLEPSVCFMRVSVCVRARLWQPRQLGWVTAKLLLNIHRGHSLAVPQLCQSRASGFLIKGVSKSRDSCDRGEVAGWGPPHVCVCVCEDLTCRRLIGRRRWWGWKLSLRSLDIQSNALWLLCSFLPGTCGIFIWMHVSSSLYEFVLTKVFLKKVQIKYIF